MIILRLMGGLGNQMFQYAMAKKLSSKGKIYVDLAYLKCHDKSNITFTARKYELTIFENIQVRIVSALLTKFILSQRKFLCLLRGILPSAIFSFEYITDESIIRHSQHNANHYLDGYFQNCSHFENIRPELLKDFEFPPLGDTSKFYQKKIETAKNSVALHVRRGDYLKPKVKDHHGILPVEYYKNAVRYVESKLKYTQYFIFSDDPAWCSNNLDFIKNKNIVSGKHLPWIDMYLMSICKHNIIANSSFSWWGAWLNQHPAKIVVAPKNWLTHSDTKIIPQEWIRL